jgi:hypothetical protein
MVFGGDVGKQKITMTIDDRVFVAFKELCKKNGMKVSSKVELLMKDFVLAFPEDNERARILDNRKRRSRR